VSDSIFGFLMLVTGALLIFVGVSHFSQSAALIVAGAGLVLALSGDDS
jgi:hypothetical protein